MFGFGKKKVTAKEMADGLWMCCRKFSGESYKDIVQMLEKAGHTLTQDKQFELSRQLIIANLWVISKALPSDRIALDHLHQHYVMGHANLAEDTEGKRECVSMANQELLGRYKQYHESWNADEPANQALLASEMLQNMVGKDELGEDCLNMMLLFPLQVHILGMMKAVRDFRTKFEIRD